MRFNFNRPVLCMALEQLGTGNAGLAVTDGNVIPGNLKVGTSTSKLGFYGGTQVAKPSVTWPNTGTATTTINKNKVDRLKNALVALGLIVTT